MKKGPLMQLLKMISLFMFGFIFGFGINHFLAEKKADQNSGLEKITSPVCEKHEPPPPCPCLYSDEILDPPNFHASMPESLVTNFEGEALVRWTDVPGAKKYTVYLETEDGQEVKPYRSTRTVLYLKDIPLPKGKFEATYALRLAAVNGKDQAGPKSKSRRLIVKPQASVMAPEVQEIRVEE
jgi:hypothetical protein